MRAIPSVGASQHPPMSRAPQVHLRSTRRRPCPWPLTASGIGVLGRLFFSAAVRPSQRASDPRSRASLTSHLHPQLEADRPPRLASQVWTAERDGQPEAVAHVSRARTGCVPVGIGRRVAKTGTGRTVSFRGRTAACLFCVRIASWRAAFALLPSHAKRCAARKRCTR